MIIEAVNESTYIVYFGDRISDDIAGQVKRATEAIRQNLSDLVIDLVPSYTSVLVCYDANRTDRFGIASRLRKALSEGEQEAPDESGWCASTVSRPTASTPSDSARGSLTLALPTNALPCPAKPRPDRKYPPGALALPARRPPSIPAPRRAGGR